VRPIVRDGAEERLFRGLRVGALVACQIAICVWSARARGGETSLAAGDGRSESERGLVPREDVGAHAATVARSEGSQGAARTRAGEERSGGDVPPSRLGGDPDHGIGGGDAVGLELQRGQVGASAPWASFRWFSRMAPSRSLKAGDARRLPRSRLAFR